jgi:hypothetical protein
MKNPAGYFAWLCPRHFHMTDLSLRAAHKAARRAWQGALRQMRSELRREREGAAAPSAERLTAVREAGDQVRTAWDALVADATIKAAFGGEG